MSYEYKQFYRRKLPHIHSPGATLFVTFRLKGSVPKSIIQRWKAEKTQIEAIVMRKQDQSKNDGLQSDESLKQFYRRWFALYEEILHKEISGPVWLKDPAIAKRVEDSFHHLNHQSYKLHAYCIMSNHAHLLSTPLLNERSLTESSRSNRPIFISEHPPISAIMQSIKGYSAREANRILGRKGQFWEPESYDHQVRNAEEFWRIVRYILDNPVKARIVGHWKDWPYSWVDPDLGYSSLTDAAG